MHASLLDKNDVVLALFSLGMTNLSCGPHLRVGLSRNSKHGIRLDCPMLHSQGFQAGGRSEECDGCDDASHLHGSQPGVRPWQSGGMLRSGGRAVRSAAAKPCRPAGPRCRAGNVHVHASPLFRSIIARLNRRAARVAGGGCCGRAEWRGAGVPAAMPLGRPAHAGSSLLSL